MRKSLPLFMMTLSITLGTASASLSQEAIAVSPGDHDGTIIDQTCPTFSWGSVAAATRYDLEIYRIGDLLSEAKLFSSRSFPGTVLSWTPSLEECFERGHRYAWVVRAVSESVPGLWSEPALFQVQPRADELELQEALRIVERHLAEQIADSNTPADLDAQNIVPKADAALPSAEPAAVPATTQLSVDGGIAALSFTGDGSALTNVVASDLVGTAVVSESELDFDPVTDAEMTTHAGVTDAHHAPPSSLPPTGTAGGDLSGTYPNPTVAASIARDSEVASAISTHAGEAAVHHTPPTSLPPSGAAGGDLAGNYPNPTVAAAIARDSELASAVSTHAGETSSHHTPPTSLPPSGAAGGDLTGDYPNPSVAASIARDTEVTAAVSAHEGEVNAHHTLPTALPPSGSAGGDLTGTYPNPAVAAAIARDSEVTSAISGHAGLTNAHHSPTVDTTCSGVACDGTSFTNLQWSNLANLPAGFSDNVDNDCTVSASSSTVTVTCSDGSSATWRLPIASRQISSGTRHTCAVLRDQSLACWGDNSQGQSSRSTYPLAQVGAGHEHTCVLITNGRLACYGDDTYGQISPPAGQFVWLSAGLYFNCGVDFYGSIACWGSDDFGQSTPPGGSFSRVSAGSYHSCGLLTSGSVTCWGDNRYGQSSAPSGTFDQIATGGFFSCGLRTDGSVTCWGDNTYGQTSPPAADPPNVYSEISAGAGHTCGVTTSGGVVCWGADDHRSSPLSGEFVSVAAGKYHTCALTSAGATVCWGSDQWGQSSPPLALR